MYLKSTISRLSHDSRGQSGTHRELQHISRVTCIVVVGLRVSTMLAKTEMSVVSIIFHIAIILHVN